MKNMTRRLLALFLALLLCVSLFPAAALAEGEEEPAPPVGDDVSDVPPEEPDVPADPDAPIGAVPGVPEQASVSPEASADLAALPPAEDAAEPEAASSGQCGDDLTWTLSYDGTLTISGTGDMWDWAWDSSAPWSDQWGRILSVVIEPGATSVGSYAFYQCGSMTLLSIPEGVTRIGDYGFAQCNNLSSVTLPDSLVSVGGWAFGWDNSLTGIYLPANLRDIGAGAFNCCSGITVYEVDPASPYYCVEDRMLFSKDMTQLVACPRDIAGEVRIPEGVTRLGSHAFFYCPSLERVVMPASVWQIGGWSFQDCFGLQSIEVAEENQSFTDVDGILYRKDLSVLLCIPRGKTGVVTLAEGTERVEWSAGMGCHGITELILPEGLTAIGNSAFSNCSSLVRVTFPASLTSIDNYAFSSCSSLREVQYAGTMAQWEQLPIGQGNDNLQRVRIVCSDGEIDNNHKCGDDLTWSLENGVLTVSGTGAMWSFYQGSSPWYADCRNITEAVVEEGVTGIGQYAFEGCTLLTGVTLPASLDSIGFQAFRSCSSLSLVRYGGTQAQWEQLRIENYNDPLIRARILCSDGEIDNSQKCGQNLCWSLENGVLTISGTGAMWNFDWNGSPWYSRRDSITSLVIEPGMTRIGQYAFQGCGNLTQVTIPEGVTSVEWSAFMSCSRLESITIPASMNDLGDVFEDCGSLQEILVAEGSESYLSLDGVVYSKDGSTLVRCPTGKSAVVIPAGVTTIRWNSFFGCSRLETVSIPVGLATIQDSSFSGCSALSLVQYGGTMAQWKQISINGGNNPLYMARILCSDGEIDNSHKCGDDLTWSLDLASGALTVSGTGPMWDFSGSENPFYPMRESIRSLVLEEGVTTIGSFALYQLDQLESITIPASLTRIGFGAAMYCSSLTRLSLDDANPVYSLANGLLCSRDGSTLILIPGGFSSVQVPEGVTGIEDCAARCNHNLTKLQLPEGLLSIGGRAFEECYSLSSVVLPASLQSIENEAFACYGKSLSLRFLGPPPSFASDCFSNTTVTAWYSVDESGWTGSVLDNYGGTVTWIVWDPDAPLEGQGQCGDGLSWTLTWDGLLTISGSGDMWNWSAGQTPWKDFSGDILSVVIEPGVAGIGSYAFYGCGSLAEVTIPETVERIGENAFHGCSSLEDIRFGGTLAAWQQLGANYDRYRVTVHCEDGDLAPADLSYCGDAVTWTYSADTGQLKIHGSGEMWNFFSFSAPWKQKGLMIQSVEIEPGVTSVGTRSFLQCTDLTEVTLPEGLEEIGDYAFAYCKALQSVTIPESVRRIGYGSFYYCSGLTEVTLPEGLENIDSAAFCECSGLVRVNLPGSVTRIGDWVFSCCANLLEIRVAEENQSFASFEGALYSKDLSVLLTYPGGAEGSPVFPENLKEIGFEAFYCCFGITEVTVPASVETLAKWCFEECSVRTIRFLGPSPSFGEDVFASSSATAYYPAWEESWTAEVLQNYGGTITWMPYEGFAVSFDANGGEGAPETLHKIPGVDLQLPEEVPTRLYHLFLGWAADPAATEPDYQPGDAYAADESVTLYAVWTEDPEHPGPRIVLEGGIVRTGTEIRVPVRLENNPGVICVEFSVVYDEAALVWIDVEEGEYDGLYDAEPGLPVSWYAEDTTIDNCEDLLFATLIFRAREDAPLDTTRIELSFGIDAVFNAAEENLEFAVEPAEIQIVDHIPGDVNGDGEVNNKDVTRLINYIKRGASAVEPAVDVNGDGHVSNKDVTRLIAYIKHGNVTIH